MKETVSFPAVMKSVTAISFSATAVLAILDHFRHPDWLLPAAITAGTTFYHFAMRLIVGAVVPNFIKQPRNRKWFYPKNFEKNLYTVLKVKHWKDHWPTYNPASFSLRSHAPEQILHTSCVSEAVHEVIILLSFIPLLFSLRWGAFPVFLITSVLAAVFDCSFVIIQRYNRPRLLRILAKKEASAP
jgi:hypothetical protein